MNGWMSVGWLVVGMAAGSLLTLLFTVALGWWLAPWFVLLVLTMMLALHLAAKEVRP